MICVGFLRLFLGFRKLGGGFDKFCSDVDDIKFVINYDYPNNSEDYVHRIGRTGRRDKKVGSKLVSNQ